MWIDNINMGEVLERFIKAQDLYGTYETALQEMKDGQKRSHWIWFIFPQLKGFGHSYNSRYYSIDGMEEAKAYLTHPVLGKRLKEITAVLLTHTDEDVVEMMGSHIDAIKLRSSMTLFDAVSPNDVFGEALDAFFDGRRDGRTVGKIRGNRGFDTP